MVVPLLQESPATVISLIVNTCCLGPRAKDVLSSGKQQHRLREFLLKCFILPQAIADPVIGEVIVAGEFEDGEGYTYVPSPSVYFGAADALAQRQAGFEASSGDIVIFQHDDHLLQLGAPPVLSADVTIPIRLTRMRRVEGEILNNGFQDGYISGHCAVYARKVIETCPWGAVPPVFTWDIEHTKQIREAGFSIAGAHAVRVYDIEYGSTPWL